MGWENPCLGHYIEASSETMQNSWKINKKEIIPFFLLQPKLATSWGEKCVKTTPVLENEELRAWLHCNILLQLLWESWLIQNFLNTRHYCKWERNLHFSLRNCFCLNNSQEVVYFKSLSLHHVVLWPAFGCMNRYVIVFCVQGHSLCRHCDDVFEVVQDTVPSGNHACCLKYFLFLKN